MTQNSKITLQFGGLAAAYDVTLTPATAYRIAGNFIRCLSTDEILAQYHNTSGRWAMGIMRATCAACLA
jgi:hypothetical protein